LKPDPHAAHFDATIRRILLSGATVLCARTEMAPQEEADRLKGAAWLAGLGDRIERVDMKPVGKSYRFSSADRRPGLPDEASWALLSECPDDDGADARAIASVHRRHAGGAGTGGGGSAPAPPASLPTGENGGAIVDLRPVQDHRRIAEGGCIVEIDVSSRLGARYFGWLALSCLEASRRNGRPAPVVMGTRGAVSRIDAVRAFSTWHRRKVRWNSRILGDYRILERRDAYSSASWIGLDERWAAAVATRAARAVASEGEGIWSVNGEGHAIHALRCPYTHTDPQKRMERTGVLLVHICPKGIRSLATFSFAEPPSDGAIARLARETWMRGIRHVSHPEAFERRAASAHRFYSLTHGDFIPIPSAVALEARWASERGSGWMAVQGAADGREHGKLLQAWSLSGPDRIARQQFLASYPSLSSLAIDPEVTRLVDARLSPVGRIRELTGMSAAVIRRTAAHPLAHFSLNGPSEWAWAGGIMQALGPDRLPAPTRSPSYEWSGLAYCAYQVRSLLRTGSSPATVAAYLLRLPGGSWFGRATHPGMANLGQADRAGFKDMLRTLLVWLGRIADMPIGDEHPVTMRIVSGFGSVAAALAASTRWHGLPALHNHHPELPDDACWPVPFAPVDLGHGWTATALGSIRALCDEGGPEDVPDADGMGGLRHCVASYAGLCFAGQSLVVSMRRADGGATSRVSTLELVPDKGGTWVIGPSAFVPRQHRAARNEDPPLESLDAAERLRVALAEGLVPIDRTALVERALPVSPKAYAPDAEVDRLWFSLLPKPFRRMDRAGLRALLIGAEPLDRGAG
jgi:hypothetical protein